MLKPRSCRTVLMSSQDVAASLDNFTSIRHEMKAALLGDLLELSEESLSERIANMRKAYSLVLFKGTRGKRMEKTLSSL